MGYDTKFKGELKFKTELSAKALAKLNTMLGEDFRDHPEWGGSGLTHIDLVLTDDFDGLRWDDETEKTYDLPQKVTQVIKVMREAGFSDFALTGSLAAQGEEAEDRWDLVMDETGTVARQVQVPVPGTKVKCPSCRHEFYVE